MSRPGGDGCQACADLESHPANGGPTVNNVVGPVANKTSPAAAALEGKYYSIAKISNSSDCE